MKIMFQERRQVLYCHVSNKNLPYLGRILTGVCLLNFGFKRTEERVSTVLNKLLNIVPVPSDQDNSNWKLYLNFNKILFFLEKPIRHSAVLIPFIPDL
jgi:hypothetical protein